MFAFKIATLLAVVVAATAVPTPAGSGTCSTGPVQCCNSIEPSDSTNSAFLAGILPIALQGLNVPFGINCNPISVIGAGSAGTCSAQTACCSGVNNEGFVPIGLDCSPINIGL